MIKPKSLFWLLGMGIVAVSIIGVWLGPVAIDANGFARAFWHPGSVEAQIILNIRLPRLLTALGVGGLLGLSGALMQGMVRNPLAEPGLMGLSGGAYLGISVMIILGLGLNRWMMEGAAFLGAISAAAILTRFGAQHLSGKSLLLFGVALTSGSGALSTLLFNLSPTPIATQEMLSWMMGSVENRDYRDAGFVLAGLSLALCLIPTMKKGLLGLTLGESVAITLGVNMRVFYGVGILLVAVMSGISVATAGMIGFVGLASAHLVRALGIRDPYLLLWPSALMGAIMTGAADIIVKLVSTDREIHIGVITAILGAPVPVAIVKQAGQVWDETGT